jgi:threonine/homoserine/homoserine lactone efflux protein
MLVLTLAIALASGFALAVSKYRSLGGLGLIALLFIQPAAFLTLLVCGLAVYWGYQHFQSKRKPRHVSRKRY